MTSLKTPHPEFYYSSFMEYVQDKYSRLASDETITGERKKFIKNQNRQLNGSTTNNRDALLVSGTAYKSSKL